VKSLLRQHRYALAVTLRRLAAAPLSSLTNLLVISLALSLPLLGASLLVSMQPVARQVSVTPELTIFLKIDAPAAAAEQIAKRVRQEHAALVAGVRVISKDRALNDLRDNPAWEQALKVLPGNPLPDAVVVSLPNSPINSRKAGVNGPALSSCNSTRRGCSVLKPYCALAASACYCWR